MWRVANDAVKCILHGAAGSSKFGGSARSRDDPQSGLRSTGSCTGIMCVGCFTFGMGYVTITEVTYSLSMCSGRS